MDRCKAADEDDRIRILAEHGEGKSDRVISDLMGRDASARFNFIMERAEYASEIDV